MKTIEERAREYAARTWQNDPEKQCPANLGYRAGAIAERADLTRWNDPDDLRPDNIQRVLVKYKKADGSFKVGIATFHHLLGIGRGSFVMEASRPQYIIGWRPIHE